MTSTYGLRGDLVTWASDQRLPPVGRDGDVPEQVRTALDVATRLHGTPEAIRASQYVLAFLQDICDDLAEARAQVLEDRAERDQLRSFKRATLAEQAQRRAAVEQAAARYAAHAS